MKYIWEICVCVLEELHSLHTGESTEDVCEGLHGIWIGCPRGVHVGMYGGRRGLYAALPCAAPMADTGHCLRHTGGSGLPLPPPPPGPA